MTRPPILLVDDEPQLVRVLQPALEAAQFTVLTAADGEGALRVPMIVAGVPGSPPGSIHRGFVHATDLAPTLLEIIGVPAPAVIAGVAQMPIEG